MSFDFCSRDVCNERQTLLRRRVENGRINQNEFVGPSNVFPILERCLIFVISWYFRVIKIHILSALVMSVLVLSLCFGVCQQYNG